MKLVVLAAALSGVLATVVGDAVFQVIAGAATTAGAGLAVFVYRKVLKPAALLHERLTDLPAWMQHADERHEDLVARVGVIEGRVETVETMTEEAGEQLKALTREFGIGVRGMG